jgi:hypothetical protein
LAAAIGDLAARACARSGCYGLWQLGHFQKQERIWMRALDRAKLLGFINVGLSPFLYWWNKLPFVPFYALTVAVLMLSGLLFLFDLNQVLQRLPRCCPTKHCAWRRNGLPR